MHKPCRVCSAMFEMTTRQINRGDYICRPCYLEQERVRRAKRKAEGRPVQTGRVSPEHYKAWYAEYSARPEVRKRLAEAARLRAQNPAERHKHEARWLARRAIKSGKITRRPCEICGNAKVDAHHDDYSRPLDVRWLCRPHHNEHHLHAKARGEAQ